MKLELKHIAPYLPFELKFGWMKEIEEDVFSTTEIFDKMVLSFENIDILFRAPKWVKPILRPLSDLTTEIEYRGNKFIPLVELLKINQTHNGMLAKYDIIKVWSDTTGLSGGLDKYFKIRFSYDTNVGLVVSDISYDTEFNRFTLRQIAPIEAPKWLQYDVLEEKLFEWGFDKFKLLEKGLAIDINTLNSQK